MGDRPLGSGSGSKRFFLALLLVALTLPALKIVVAGGYIYEPGLAVASPTRPTLTLLPPNSGAGGIDARIGPNATSANISVVASKGISQVLSNPDAYTSADYWYCVPGTYLSCYYLSSDVGASGGVLQIYGAAEATSRRLTTVSDYAFVVQDFRVAAPSSAIEADVRYRLANSTGTLLTLLIIMIYDLNTSSSVYTYQTSISQSSTYSWENISISNAQLDPTHVYVFAVGVQFYAILSTWLNPEAIVDFRVDSAYLYVSTTYYTYTGTVLQVNNTVALPRYAQLILVGGNVSPDLNCTLSIVSSNPNAPQASPIVIQNGEVVSNTTGIVELDTGSTLYTSGYIELQASKVNATNSTLVLLLVYYGGPNVTDGELDVVSSNGTVGLSPYQGVVGFYPIIVTIDPGGVRVEVLGGRGVGG